MVLVQVSYVVWFCPLEWGDARGEVVGFIGRTHINSLQLAPPFSPGSIKVLTDLRKKSGPGQRKPSPYWNMSLGSYLLLPLGPTSSVCVASWIWFPPKTCAFRHALVGKCSFLRSKPPQVMIRSGKKPGNLYSGNRSEGGCAVPSFLQGLLLLSETLQRNLGQTVSDLPRFEGLGSHLFHCKCLRRLALEDMWNVMDFAVVAASRQPVRLWFWISLY